MIVRFSHFVLIIVHIIDNSVEQENTEVIKEVNEPLTESGVKEAVSTTDLTSEVPKDTLSDDSADSPIEDDSLEDKPTTVIHNPITNKPLPKKSKKSSKQKSLFRRNRHVNDTPKFFHLLFFIIERNQS